MTDLLSFTIVGLVTGAAYAIASSGLVITYATSNVFNMAHGAVGMIMAFLFWELAVAIGLPSWLALLLVVGVIAPLFGAFLERVMMRRLTDASVTVSLTVTVGLLVMLIGAAQTIWPPGARRVEEFLPGTGLRIFGVFVTGHEILTFVLGAVVAGGLYVLLNRTRTGTAMRAIVDNRELLALHGARPQLLGMLSWAIGSALAALAGILLVPKIQLDYYTLTLLVINAYAAAMVGRLKNLPRTFVGAMILGLVQSYVLMVIQMLPDSVLNDYRGLLAGFRAAVPTLFLFATMLLMPQQKLRVGATKGASLVRLPGRRRSVVYGLAMVLVVSVLTLFLSNANTAVLGKALALSLIMLSLVVLTGYGGDVSLSQMTFVGVGALVVARIFGTVTPEAILAATLVSALVGALVALPALRLRGLYLGLGTLAFAVAMDNLVFKSERFGFQLGGSRLVNRPEILGISFKSEQAFTILVAVAFVAMALFVLGLRRGRFGRLLLATRDSAAACGTLGLSITRTRVLVFAVSAGMAGFGGAIYSGMYVSVGTANFEMFQSLPILLLAVVGGITSVSGALIGGLALGLVPTIQDAVPQLGNVIYLLIGVAAISLGRNPNGVAGLAFDAVRRWRGEAVEPHGTPTTDEDDEMAGEVSVVGAS